MTLIRKIKYLFWAIKNINRLDEIASGYAKIRELELNAVIKYKGDCKDVVINVHYDWRDVESIREKLKIGN